MPRSRIAVFGSSEAFEGEPLYEEARQVGRLLAEAGYEILTGGYGGVMEGASRGAREVGGRAVGITSTIFRGRSPNPYLNEAVEVADLHERTRQLIERADAYVVLWGKAGTLAEIALVWALERAGSLDARPVVLLGDSWGRVLQVLSREGILDEAESCATRWARSPADVLTALRDGPGRGGEG